MSALGHKQTSRGPQALSALPPKADKQRTSRYVRFVPKADICIAAFHLNRLLGACGRMYDRFSRSAVAQVAHLAARLHFAVSGLEAAPIRPPPIPPSFLPPTDLADRDRGRSAGDESKVGGQVVELDANRNALRQADPAERRIDQGQQIGARAPVLVLDTRGNTFDGTGQHAGIADQLDARFLADMDAAQLGLLEITLDAKRIGIDKRKDTRAGIDITARQQTEIRNNAVDGGQHRRTFEIELSNFE